jgi:restriction system protein
VAGGHTAGAPLKALDAALDRFLDWVVAAYARLSGRTAFAVALVLYPGLALALPIALGWPAAALATANLLFTFWAALLVLGWLFARVEAQRRRLLVEWTTDLRLLDAREFEWLVGELLRREGWEVEEVGGHGVPDGNVDLRLRRGGERRIVQCKRWTARQVGVDEVRALAGTLLREGLPGSAGLLVTLSEFTPAAEEEARQAAVALVDHRGVYERVERARRPEPCPRCGAAMRLDRSVRGWWFRCVTGGCDGKRDLGTDPARAVELLTELR